ncbi:hypothetical protein ACSZMQ_12290 [Aeromonas rivipollensis]
MNKRCPFTINLMLHSMGNYLFKHLLGSSTYNANHLLFDNVVMVAADTNNEHHAEWSTGSSVATASTSPSMSETAPSWRHG